MVGIAALFPFGVCAEFHVWQDEQGIRHISTHPRSCLDGGRVRTLRPGCEAWHLTAEQTKNLEVGRAQQQREKQAAAFAEECDALKENRNRLAAAIRQTKVSFTTRVARSTSDVDASNMSLEDLINMPAKAAKLQADMLAADKAYDKCFPALDRKNRINARNEIRRQIAANAKRAQQDDTLRRIEGELRRLKDRLKY